MMAAAPPLPAPVQLGAPVRVRHDALHRGGRLVVEAGELALPAGAVTGLVGANGAGKSTLLLAIARLLRGRTADVRVTCGGRELRDVGFVPQSPTWPPWLRVREAAALLGVDAAHLAADEPSLALAPLLERRADALSAGQAQTLAVACALLRDDPLVLLDEPFAAVDLARRRALRRLLHAAHRRRPALVTVLSSHAAAELLATCDWIVVLRDGRYAYQGSSDSLLDDLPGDRMAPDAIARFEARLADLTG